MRKIIIALSTLLALVSFAPTAQAASFLSMNTGKAKVRQTLHKLNRNNDYLDGYINSCWRKSAARIVCSTTMVTYTDVSCDSDVGVRRDSYGVWVYFPGRVECYANNNS
jgi:hypothetical protein